MMSKGYEKLPKELKTLFRMMVVIIGSCIVTIIASDTVGLAVDHDGSYLSVTARICRLGGKAMGKSLEAAETVIRQVYDVLKWVSGSDLVTKLAVLSAIGLGLYLYNKYSPV